MASWSGPAAGFLDAGARLASSVLADPEPIESDRRFKFPTRRTAVWGAISGVDNYRRWWPWLREFQGVSLTSGDVWTCVVQPPVPYSLRFSLHIDEVVPGRLVVARIEGDIRGHARLELHDRLVGCEVRLQSSLAPHHPVLRAVASMARPMARYGHDWILDTGARQFGRRVARQYTDRPG